MSYLHTTKDLKGIVGMAEDQVCKTYSIDRSLIYDFSRAPRSVQARFATWFLLREKFNLSFPEIGKYYGFNHTSIVHGVRQAKCTGIPEELGFEFAEWKTPGQYVEKSLIHGDKGVDEKGDNLGTEKVVRNSSTPCSTSDRRKDGPN